jgi:hypothetical protein
VNYEKAMRGKDAKDCEAVKDANKLATCRKNLAPPVATPKPADVPKPDATPKPDAPKEVPK